MTDPTDVVTDRGHVCAPYLPTDPVLWPAWLGCLHWAIGEPDILEAFRTETGNGWRPGRTPLESMIDEATGVDRAFVAAFAAWMNANIWGDA